MTASPVLCMAHATSGTPTFEPVRKTTRAGCGFLAIAKVVGIVDASIVEHLADVAPLCGR